jgi:hypothetical protein
MRSRTVTADGYLSERQHDMLRGRRGLPARWVALLINSTIMSSGGYDGGGAIANGPATLTLDNATLSNTADLQTDWFASTIVENTILAAGPRAVSYFGPRADSRNNLERDRLGELEVSALSLEGVPVPGRSAAPVRSPAGKPQQGNVAPTGTTCRTWHSVTQTGTLSASVSTTCQR